MDGMMETGKRYQSIVHLPIGVLVDQEDDRRVYTNEKDVPPNLEDDCALETQHHPPLGINIYCCAVFASHVEWMCLYICMCCFRLVEVEWRQLGN